MSSFRSSYSNNSKVLVCQDTKTFFVISDALSSLVNSVPSQAEAVTVGPDRACLEHVPVDRLEQRPPSPVSRRRPRWPLRLPEEHREGRFHPNDERSTTATVCVQKSKKAKITFSELVILGHLLANPNVYETLFCCIRKFPT
jgi:hypothetical protein